MKKFANAFELLAEAERLGREIEMHYGDGTWHTLNILENSKVGVIRELFDEGNLRLKPKFKTVEGWTSVHPVCGTGSTTLSFYPASNSIYKDAEVAKANLRAGCVLAKITFEVEE